jgi:hypothetical protein
MSKEKLKILAEIENAIFPVDDDESTGIEHIDMSYKEFISKLRKLAE